MRVIEGDATRIDLRRAVSEGPAKVVASLPYNVAMPILVAGLGNIYVNEIDVSGAPGEFQQHFRVYDRDGEACVRCGGIIRRRVIVGRSSFFCPRCQR